MLKANKTTNGYIIFHTKVETIKSYTQLLKFLRKNKLKVMNKIEDSRGNVVTLVAK